MRTDNYSKSRFKQVARERIVVGYPITFARSSGLTPSRSTSLYCYALGRRDPVVLHMEQN